jgi:hypothetical protein
MRNLINKLISKFRKSDELEQVVRATYYSLQNSNDNLIAIARLSLIKPEVLVREARNVQANSDYLLKMIEAQQNEKNN